MAFTNSKNISSATRFSAKKNCPPLLRIRRRIGHLARLCPSDELVNDFEVETLKGKDTNEDECWAEDDDDTLRMEYLYSDAELMTSAPGLRDGPWYTQIAKSKAMPHARHARHNSWITVGRRQRHDPGTTR